jgi:hypothetical protein
LAEIFPLRLRLREKLRFQKANGAVVTERVSDLQRFSLRPWQYEMLRRMDGTRTFEEVSREVYQYHRGQFTSVGLLNFYRWLYQENLIVCECESVFELADAVEETPNPVAQVTRQQTQKPRTEPEETSTYDRVVAKLQARKSWQQQALKISAMVLFSLAVLRLAYVIAPVFEPPVNRLYAELENYFYDSVQPTSVEGQTDDVPEPSQQEMAVAAQAQAQETIPEPLPIPAPQLQPELPAPAASPVDLTHLDGLRRRLAECRIRRDEFYIQNDEQGYREEVAKMSELVREIGELESRL